MTSLEFIEKEIKYEKERIKIWDSKLKSSQTLTHLQQIKNDLEAWEVVKLKEVDLYDVTHTTNYKQYESENVDLLKEYFLTQQEYEIIKKALEVDDA